MSQTTPSSTILQHGKAIIVALTVLEMAAAYAVVLRALDTGSLWEYLFMFVLLALVVRNMWVLGRMLRRGKRQARKA